jgi:hypothetical protein
MTYFFMQTKNVTEESVEDLKANGKELTGFI